MAVVVSPPFLDRLSFISFTLHVFKNGQNHSTRTKRNVNTVRLVNDKLHFFSEELNANISVQLKTVFFSNEQWHTQTDIVVLPSFDSWNNVQTAKHSAQSPDKSVPADQPVVFIGCFMWTLIQTMPSHELWLFFGQKSRNKSFRMISIWFLYFWTILDRENLYISKCCPFSFKG